MVEKNGELFELVNEINKEIEFDVLFFLIVGVSNGYIILLLYCVFGDIVGFVNLLNNENDYYDIVNVIEMYKLKKFLGIDDDKDDDNNEE